MVWRRFLDNFNGKSFFLSAKWLTSRNLNLYKDSAGSLGYAAVFGTHWFNGEWPENWKYLNITISELLYWRLRFGDRKCAINALSSFLIIMQLSI